MNPILNREETEGVARLVQKAFLDIRDNLNSGMLTGAQKAAVASLPLDNVTKKAENRLRKFPNECCMDASFVLAIIFTALAEQNGFKFGQLAHIRCRPTDKTKTALFDFHQWLCVDGFSVDIAFEQCKTVLKGNEGKIVFNVHPLIGSDNFIYEQADAVIEEPFAEFANFVIMNYFGKRA
jgi:hypothetical protein